jgi:predicted GIY-YIG superfamily endonuclease
MYVYFLRAGNKGAIKIGMAKDVDRRVAELQTGNAFKLNVIALIPCDCREQAEYTEKRLHKFFRKQKIRGEWFQGNIDFKKLL